MKHYSSFKVNDSSFESFENKLSIITCRAYVWLDAVRLSWKAGESVEVDPYLVGAFLGTAL